MTAAVAGTAFDAHSGLALPDPKAVTTRGQRTPSWVFSELQQFTAHQSFPAGYDENMRMLLAPRDDGHSALDFLFNELPTRSLQGGMFGFDDPKIAAYYALYSQVAGFYDQLSLDRSQTAAKTETAILADFATKGIYGDGPGSSVAIGTSSVKGAISHLKQWVIDGAWVLDGSMNESQGGENWQNNSLLVIYSPVIAAQVAHNLNLIHNEMLQQMARRAKTA